MNTSVESTGKTIDAAISAALNQLQTDRDSVTVEVLENPKTGFLGIGGTPARVRVSLLDGHEDEPSAPARKEKQPPPKPQKQTAEKTPVSKPASASPARAAAPAPAAPPASSSGTVPSGAAAILQGILDRMGIKNAVVDEVAGEHHLLLDVKGTNLGRLIGRRGETLDAVQRIVSTAYNRSQTERRRIVVDAEQYRAKREETLVQLAVSTAEKAVKYNRDMLLEPMNAYSRHVVHAALQDNPYVTTHSVGNEPQRRVIISLSGADKKPVEVRKKV